MSESLGFDVVAVKARICGLAALLEERTAVRNSMGAILLAIVVEFVVNGTGKAKECRAVKEVDVVKQFGELFRTPRRPRLHNPGQQKIESTLIGQSGAHLDTMAWASWAQSLWPFLIAMIRYVPWLP